MKIKIFEFNLFGENTYVTFDEVSAEAAIIDPGMMNKRECDEIESFIRENNLKVKYLLNTHMHVDHVAGDEYIETRCGVGLSASSLDEPLASRIAQQARMFHLDFNVVDSAKIAHPLKNNDRLWLGKTPVDVLEVPGHSPGSLAFYFPENGFVITGDALFRQSIGRTDLPGGDFDTLVDSIKNRLMTLPPETVVFPGHGPRTTIADEKRLNPYLR